MRQIGFAYEVSMTSAQEGSAINYAVLTHRRMAFHLLLLIWEVSFPDTLPQKRTWYPRLINIDVGVPCLLRLLQVLVDTWEEPYWPSSELVQRGEAGGKGWEGETTLESEDRSLSCPDLPPPCVFLPSPSPPSSFSSSFC